MSVCNGNNQSICASVSTSWGNPSYARATLQILSTAPTSLALRVHSFSPTPWHTGSHTSAKQPLPLYPFGGVAPTLLAQHVPVHIVNQGKPIVNVHENQLLGGDLPERFLFAQHRGSLRGVRGKITEAGGGGGGKGGEEGHIRVVPKRMFRKRTRNRV